MNVRLLIVMITVTFSLVNLRINAFVLPSKRCCINKSYMPKTSFQLFNSYSVAPSETKSTPLPPAISVEELTCSHDGGGTYQLSDVSYVLPRGGKIGLVGRNGCGKSTLLKILAEACCPDLETGKGGKSMNQDEGVVYTGKVEKSKNCRVAYVEQEPPMPSDVTVEDAILGIVDATSKISLNSKTTVYSVVKAYKLAMNNAAEDPTAFAEACAIMDALNGWDVLTKADEVATKLRVKDLEKSPLSTLSGGERKRVALAAALIVEPDVLLLDEPTNHLDLSAIRWLSDLIKDRQKITLLTVTHDRFFLEDVCDSIVELDRGSLYSYQGNYGTYLEKKAERLSIEDAAIQSAKSKYKVELDWMRRQPQARATKQKARQDAFYKLEKATKPRALDPNLDMGKDGQRRLGNNILKLKNISLKFADNKVILDDFSYNFNKGDKLGVVGANGIGKSTFIKVLTGQQEIDSGEIETGETVVFGIYDQMGIEMDEKQRVMDFVKQRVEARDGSSMAEAPQEAMKLLKQFQFERERWDERISFLSGGERRRLQLLAVLTKRPNFLVLDEPTNDIDLDTLSALEDYLEEYKGVLVIVSHDRFFTDKVTDHLFVFEGNGIVKDFSGTLSDYSECLVELENAPNSSTSDNSSDGQDRQITYQEDKKARMQERNELKKNKREMSKLEKDIEKLKAQVPAIEQEIESSADEGWSHLAQLHDKMTGINEEIDEKEMIWLELAEAIELAESN
mmetsp:Transcript_6173/g.6917  ORF Transcript_6173/g.6917 Transcript_6173/m.6917 type:complete len:736 (+) Transcript_6173:207-2414(+)